MLIGLHPLLTPDLLHALAAMGHGDRIALVDANYPAASSGRTVIELPGTAVDVALASVLSLLPIDDFVPDPAHTMAPVETGGPVPEAVRAIDTVLARYGAKPSAPLERFAFYAEAQRAFVVVRTGERRLYGNVLVTKGVVRS